MRVCFIFSLLLGLSATSPLNAGAEAWTPLFPDDTFALWQQLDQNEVGAGWSIQNGVVHRQGLKAGNIVTRQHYLNFELQFEWKISTAGNSGIKYRTRGKLGLEYQILDDEKHPDRQKASRRSAALYDLAAAPDTKPLFPPGEWNKGLIRVQGNQIEHWLNGEKVVSVTYGSPDWQQRFSDSKYAAHEGFGSWSGPILLQDHKDEVWFRNVMIRKLR